MNGSLFLKYQKLRMAYLAKDELACSFRIFPASSMEIDQEQNIYSARYVVGPQGIRVLRHQKFTSQ